MTRRTLHFGYGVITGAVLASFAWSVLVSWLFDQLAKAGIQ